MGLKKQGNAENIELKDPDNLEVWSQSAVFRH